MKRTTTAAFAAFAVLLLALPLAAQEGGESHGGDVSELGRARKASPGSKIISRFKYAPLEWKVPKVGEEVKRIEWKEGPVVYVMEDHTLPLVSIRAQVHTGSLYEPAEKTGLASMTGSLMRDGGTTSWTADEIDRELEFYAAYVRSWIGDEEGSVSLSCLSDDLDKVLPIWAEVLMSPRFAPDKIELERHQTLESIRRRFDNPGSTLSYVYNERLYGDHPLGRTPEWTTVSAITRDDLVAFHDRYFAPNNAMIAIVGDVDATTLRKVRDALRSWRPKPVALPRVPPVSRPTPGVWFVEQDINQTNVAMGHLGPNWDDPDRYAIAVMNFILGGGSFTSRMTERVRSDEGLAYSVGSSFSTGHLTGAFTARAQTRVDATTRTLDLMRETIEGMRNAPPTEAELQQAKDSYINGYIFNFQRPESVVSQLMDLEFYDRPRDLLETYLDRIRAVTVADVQRVAGEYLHPDRMVVVVVGKQQDFDRPLGDLAWVQRVQVAELPKVPETEEGPGKAAAAGGRPRRRRR